LLSSSNHDRFLTHLRASDSARWLVASWLVSRGHLVSLQPQRYAPSADKWKEYADKGDLMISFRIEVKQRSFDFTSREDWPFKGDFIVCARHSFDDARPKPFGYIHVNRAGTHAGYVRSSSARTWHIENVKDSRYDNVAQETYFAPLNVVTFFALNEPLPEGEYSFEDYAFLHQLERELTAGGENG